MPSYLPAFNQMALLFLGRAQDNTKMLDLAGGRVPSGAADQRQLRAHLQHVGPDQRARRRTSSTRCACSRSATQLDAKNFEAHMNFGQITLSFRGYEDARKAFSKAVELKPKSYDAHVGLGAALRGLDDAEGAKKQYEEAKGLAATVPRPTSTWASSTRTTCPAPSPT